MKRKVNDVIPEKFQVHPHSEKAPSTYDMSGQRMVGKKKVALVHEPPHAHIREIIPVHPRSEDQPDSSLIHVVDLITKQVDHALDPIKSTMSDIRLPCMNIKSTMSDLRLPSINIIQNQFLR